ncbi:MAG: hypothetical protein PHR35_01465 [Kiritimatiellae bacterium]|nr:hypothetical protein [Kiritimatiellia bacterium]
METMTRRNLEQLQLERLQALVARLKRSVRYYRDRLSDVRVSALQEIASLPLTGPEDLAAAFPYGMLALPLREVMRIQSTVGPGGSQLVAGYTRNDLAHWGRLAARQYAAASITSHDVIQVSIEGGALPGAHGYALGAERLEASVVAEDPYGIEHQLELLRNYRATVLVTTPTRASALAAQMASAGVDPHTLFLQTVLLSRPVTAAEREALKLAMFVEVRSGFGVPEVMDPGLCVECAQGKLHINEDHFLTEIVDGELVLTTLCREAMPLLRYRTRIGAELARETCACGRTGVIVRPAGRLDDRLLVGERWIDRAQIAKLLDRTTLRGHDITIEVRADRAIVTVRLTASLFQDTVRALEALQTSVATACRTELGILCELRFMDAHSINAQQRN